MKKHAKLSASGAHRWLNCTKAPTLEALYEDEQSEYAAEGTKAHDLGEKLLNRYLNQGKLKFTKTEEKNHDNEMLDYVMAYGEYVAERIGVARAADKHAQILVEARLDFAEYVPDGFGTGDMVIVANNTIEIIDLKYGKGVSVSAEDNPQMKLYALGAYEENKLFFNIETISMTIYQPRINNISTSTISINDLLMWGASIKPIADKAFNGEGDAVAGSHCKFCKARYDCKANAEEKLKMFDMYGDSEGDLLSDAEIADIVLSADEVIKWCKGVQEYALKNALESHKKYPGLKVVEGRSVRKISDTDGAVATLRENGIDDSIIFKPKELQGITALSKALGKKAFSEIMDKFIYKPPGKPVLVSTDDKRPEYISFNDTLI